MYYSGSATITKHIGGYLVDLPNRSEVTTSLNKAIKLVRAAMEAEIEVDVDEDEDEA